MAYVYDAFGRTIEEKYTKNDAVSRWIKTDYDEFDRETSVADVQSGISHRYSYALGSNKKSTDTADQGSGTGMAATTTSTRTTVTIWQRGCSTRCMRTAQGI